MWRLESSDCEGNSCGGDRVCRVYRVLALSECGQEAGGKTTEGGEAEEERRDEAVARHAHLQ